MACKPCRCWNRIFHLYIVILHLTVIQGNVRYRSTGDITAVDGTNPGDPCVFPFKYGDEYHFSCVKQFGGIDGDTVLYMWCATTDNFDIDAQWAMCASERCQWEHYVPRYSFSNRIAYVGTQNRSHSGHTCQNWLEDTPHYSLTRTEFDVEDATIADAGNYCRNPGRNMIETSCMVTNNFRPPFNTTEACNIPLCLECNKEVDGTHTASFGVPEDSYLASAGWCGDAIASEIWLQIEFTTLHRIIGIITMGVEGLLGPKTVATYEILYSTDGVIWTDYAAVLAGNNDATSQVATALTPFVTNFLKIVVQLFIGEPCIRVAIFGCEVTEGQCLSDPCQNGGTCEEANTGYFCDCPLEYTGENCETEFDPCGILECYAGGTCVPSADGLSASCQCVDGFSGDHCQDSDVVYDSCYDLAIAGITTSDYYSLNLYSDGSCEVVISAATSVRDGYSTLPTLFISEEECMQSCLEDPLCKMGYVLSGFFSFCIRFTEYYLTSIGGSFPIFIKYCHEPRPVYCDFTDPSNPEMHIFHNMPDDFAANIIPNAESRFTQIPIYFESSAGIEAIKFNSFSCSQSLEWKCRSSVLDNSRITFWDDDDVPLYHPEMACQCVFEDPVGCEGCLCTSGSPVEEVESTVFTNKNKLPIKMLDAGDADGISSFVTFTLGPLKCVQPLTDLDECVSSPCQNGAACKDERYYYTCDCVAGYTGVSCETDIDDCASQPCLSNGDCYDGVNSFTCQCVTGLQGDICEINIDDCSPGLCANGGSCVDQINDYYCLCQQGFIGSSCEIDMNECESEPCQNGGTCENLSGSFNCQCIGYEGAMCETEVDECQSNPCANGGQCEDQFDSFTCTCAGGYSGLTCDININECDSDPCMNGANCEDEVNGYTCICSTGFTSERCEINVDDCGIHLCSNGASCVDGVNEYTCDCASGFTGDYCELEIEECLSEPCQHDGRCVEAVNGYACECLAGYAGQDCETDIIECSSNPCKNGATCVDMVGRYFCNCRAGFGGQQCDNFVVDGQWGGWMGWTVCSSNCGTGIRTRMRECNNPNPQYGGEYCEGAMSEGELCYQDGCDSIDGEWGDWGEWGRCSATCGPGTTERFRECEKLKGAGRPCQGDYNDVTYCKDHECGVAINGRWSYWSPWSQCSATCGISSKIRFRTCTDPPAVFGGKPCEGANEDKTGCLEVKCPELEKCSEWSAWGACSTTCGDGTYRRSRTCTEKLEKEEMEEEEEETPQLSSERTEYECEHCQTKKCEENECYTCSSTYDGTVSSLQCKGPTMKCPADKEYCMYKFSKKGNVTGLTKSCASAAMCSESLTEKCISLRTQTINGFITHLKQLKCSRVQVHPDTVAQLWRDIKEECRICCTSSRCNKGILPPGNTLYSRATSVMQQYSGLFLLAAVFALSQGLHIMQCKWM